MDLFSYGVFEDILTTGMVMAKVQHTELKFFLNTLPLVFATSPIKEHFAIMKMILYTMATTVAITSKEMAMAMLLDLINFYGEAEDREELVPFHKLNVVVACNFDLLLPTIKVPLRKKVIAIKGFLASHMLNVLLNDPKTSDEVKTILGIPVARSLMVHYTELAVVQSFHMFRRSFVDFLAVILRHVSDPFDYATQIVKNKPMRTGMPLCTYASAALKELKIYDDDHACQLIDFISLSTQRQMKWRLHILPLTCLLAEIRKKTLFDYRNPGCADLVFRLHPWLGHHQFIKFRNDNFVFLYNLCAVMAEQVVKGYVDKNRCFVKYFVYQLLFVGSPPLAFWVSDDAERLNIYRKWLGVDQNNTIIKDDPRTAWDNEITRRPKWDGLYDSDTSENDEFTIKGKVGMDDRVRWPWTVVTKYDEHQICSFFFYQPLFIPSAEENLT